MIDIVYRVIFFILIAALGILLGLLELCSDISEGDDTDERSNESSQLGEKDRR